MKKCDKHNYCYDPCKACNHCDTSYEENPKLECNCAECKCHLEYEHMH